MRTMTSRAMATAAAAAIALSAFAVSPADARGRGNDAAAAAIMLGMFGTMAAIIASQRHDDDGYAPVYGEPVYGGWQASEGGGVYRGHPGFRPHGGHWEHGRH